MELEVYKKSDFYEDYISSQKEYYERSNADAYFAERLAEKDKEIAELKEENLNLKAKNIELQSFYDLHGNVDNYIDKLKAENVELKQELEEYEYL